MPGSLRLGKIAGIEISLHMSWLIIVVLLTWSLATGWFAALYPGWSTLTYWAVSVLAALLLFVSVLLHELAHSLVARARGLPVKNITLLVIRGGTSPLAAILGYLAVSNVLLGLFNLVPGFPLDGGRVLRSIVWKISGSVRTATRAATMVGQVIAYLFILGGIWLLFGGYLLDGLWIGFIGWFLLSGAQSTNSQLLLETLFKRVTVGEVMNPSPVTVPANMSLQKLVDELLLPRGWRSAFVMQIDQLAGLITLREIRHIPREQWRQIPVGLAMILVEQLHVISPQQSLNEVLPLMVVQDVNQLPIVVDGRLAGVLSWEDIMRFLEIRRGLGLDAADK